jgi:hypothetical protein
MRFIPVVLFLLAVTFLIVGKVVPITSAPETFHAVNDVEPHEGLDHSKHIYGPENAEAELAGWQGRLKEFRKTKDLGKIGEAEGKVDYWQGQVKTQKEQADVRLISANEAERAQERAQTLEYVKKGVQIGLTVVLLGGALFTILSKRYTPTDKHWAYGTLGTLLGFWLKG